MNIYWASEKIPTIRTYSTQIHDIRSRYFDLEDALRLFESDSHEPVPKMIGDYRINIYRAEMNLRDE